MTPEERMEITAKGMLRQFIELHGEGWWKVAMGFHMGLLFGVHSSPEKCRAFVETFLDVIELGNTSGRPFDRSATDALAKELVDTTFGADSNAHAPSPKYDA